MGKWDKTDLMEVRLGNILHKKDGKLYFGDRFVIHRNTPIDGGVCFGEGEREAVVVDSKKYSAINRVYAKLRSRISDKHIIIKDVFETVDEILEYDEDFAEYVANKFPDQKITLDVFIEEGKGVCRHMALLCGVLLEKLGKDGIVKGRPSIDRNSIPAVGGHAWCRYTNSAGEVFILDVAQHFRGRLEDCPKNMEIAGHPVWEYYRPED